MFLFCTKPFPFQDCLQQVILTVRMKAFLLKSLIQISDGSISLFIFFPVPGVTGSPEVPVQF